MIKKYNDVYYIAYYNDVNDEKCFVYNNRYINGKRIIVSKYLEFDLPPGEEILPEPDYSTWIKVSNYPFTTFIV